jgi:hypothetical protein
MKKSLLVYMLECCITYLCNCWVYVKPLQRERTIIFLMWITLPFHWHSRPLVALVSCFVVAFVLLTRLPQRYIRHWSMHVYRIIGGTTFIMILANNYSNYQMHGIDMLHCMKTLHRTKMLQITTMHYHKSPIIIIMTFIWKTFHVAYELTK